MKTFGYIIGTIFAFLLLGAMLGGNGSGTRNNTQYQKCKETASHLRSDRDTTQMMNAICENLPVEAGDYR